MWDGLQINYSACVHHHNEETRHPLQQCGLSMLLMVFVTLWHREIVLATQTTFVNRIALLVTFFPSRDLSTERKYVIPPTLSSIYNECADIQTQRRRDVGSFHNANQSGSFQVSEDDR